MGNDSGKNKNCAETEVAHNRAQFLAVSKGKKIITRDDLEKLWLDRIETKLCSCLLSMLFCHEKPVDFERYNVFAETILRGNFNDRTELVLQILSTHDLNSITTAFFLSEDKIEKTLATRNYKSWRSSGQFGFDRVVKYCCREAGTPSKEYGFNDIKMVLSAMDAVWSQVGTSLFAPEQTLSSLYPEWLHLVGDAAKRLDECSVLEMQDILFLNMQLLGENQLEWRLVYSTKIHGENFSRLSGQILNQGATVLVIEDKDSHIFGGFAPESWMLSPKYLGNASSFLFSLQPEMSIFPTSGFNDNYQYLNQGQQTLPNGLGMGGCLEYFGIWLDSEFGKGVCNDSCTTYRNFRRLSKNKEFCIGDVEVWAVGKPPPSAEELGERSVLDGNFEAKALLHMAGRKIHSEGLRDEPKD